MATPLTQTITITLTLIPTNATAAATATVLAFEWRQTVARVRCGLEAQLVALWRRTLLARALPIPQLERAKRGSHERVSRPLVPSVGLEWDRC